MPHQTHAGLTSSDELSALRRQVLGIGEEGLLANVVRVGMRAAG